MESTTSIDQVKANFTDNPVLYRAFGWVVGTYQPSEENIHQGSFVTFDGLNVPAQMTWQLRGRLKHRNPDYATQPDFFKQSYRWTVYPKTDPLQFYLTGMKSRDLEAKNVPGLDEFRIVGEVLSCESGFVNIHIQRNQQPRWGRSNTADWKPFTLTLLCSVVPPEAVGQIWELEARRDLESLVVAAGRPYEPSEEDLVWIQKLQLQHSTAKKATGYSDKPAAARATPLPSPVIKSKPPGQTKTQEQADEPPVDATNAPPVPSAVASTPEAKEVPDYPPASPNADTNLTAGKMEVVVKLNQFPDDVRTVDKGWKEFEVDTGDCRVTITIKPKMFAALEQAQQSYPSWIAAISGPMGEMTATGFRLSSPALKVFERKAKSSSQPEEDTIKDNPSQPPATEAQPSPPVPDPTQRPAALHKQGLQQPSSPANPTDRIKLPWLSKTTPPAGQQQQRATSTAASRPQSASRTPKAETTSKRLEQKPVGNQPAASTTKAEPQPEKPAFKVKVNDQVFTGRDSVTLTQRIVRVDGKPVGQAKMVIVLGQPRIMQADGGVSQARNQAVLTSR